jgi:hypothetical protein
MAWRDRWRITPAIIAQLVAGIVLLCVCASSTTSKDPTIVTAAQVGLALVGAWLGSLIPRMTLSGEIVQTATSSVRQLLDHAASLGGIIEMVDRQRREDPVDPAQGEEILLGYLDDQVRAALRETETAVDNWNDLAPGVAGDLVASYSARHGRLSSATKPGLKHDTKDNNG